MQAAVRQLKAELAQEAVQLSLRRRAAAGSLRAAVERCLADLSMAGSRFDVCIGWEEYPKVRPLTQLAALLWGLANLSNGCGALCMP